MTVNKTFTLDAKGSVVFNYEKNNYCIACATNYMDERFPLTLREEMFETSTKILELGFQQVHYEVNEFSSFTHFVGKDRFESKDEVQTVFLDTMEDWVKNFDYDR